MTQTPPESFDLGETRFFSARDGLRIHVRVFGPQDADATPLVCLPGLTRNSRDFLGLADHFAHHAKTPRRVYAFDFRGRGMSGHDSDWQKYNVITEAEDVVAGLDAFGIEHAVFVGTSRGGLVTMVLAGMRPGAIAAAVLNDIGPVLEGTGLAQIRQYLDRPAKPANWAEAVAIQKSIMEPGFAALDDADWWFEARARFREIDGRIRPDHDPKLIKVVAAIDLGDRLPQMWPQFAGLNGVPVMVIRGQTSTLLTEETVGKMAERHPRLTTLSVPGQGHAPMLHTGDIPRKIEAFLRAV